MSQQALLNEMRQIKNFLKPDMSYIERFNLSKASVVSTFVSDALMVDGQEFNLYVISTDGNIDDISYQVTNQGGGKVNELEAAQFPYIPGPVAEIRFKNDVAQAGKFIQVTAYKISRLAPAMPPPSPPGTRSEIVDPHILIDGVEIPYSIAIATNPAFKTLSAAVTTTNTVDALDFPEGTAYSVPAGKKLIIPRIAILSTAALKGTGIVVGDDEQTNGTTLPTNNNQPVRQNFWVNATANQTFYPEAVLIEVAASLFPHIYAGTTSGTLTVSVLGVEVDA